MGISWPQTTEQTLLAVLMIASLVYIVKLFTRKEPLSVGYVDRGILKVAKKPSTGIPGDGLALPLHVDLGGKKVPIDDVYENMCGGMDTQCKCDGNETV